MTKKCQHRIKEQSENKQVKSLEPLSTNIIDAIKSLKDAIEKTGQELDDIRMGKYKITLSLHKDLVCLWWDEPKRGLKVYSLV